MRLAILRAMILPKIVLGIPALAVVGGIVYLVANWGVDLASNIDDGECMLSFSLGDMCVIDSFIVSAMATAGATLLFGTLAVLRTAGLQFLLKTAIVLTTPGQDLPVIAQNFHAPEHWPVPAAAPAVYWTQVGIVVVAGIALIIIVS